MLTRSVILLTTSLLLLRSISNAAIVGQWEFNNVTEPFAASVGQALEYLDPLSDTPSQTQVGTTASFGISAIGGADATVMKFGTNGFGRGYLAPHGISANGDGGMVNNWTVIMDVLFPASSSGEWRALLQTDPANAVNDDAEVYLNESNGIGINSAYFGNVTAKTWVRLTVVADLDAGAEFVRFYINGTRVGQVAGTVDGRFSLAPESAFALFTDGYETDVYTQPGYINSLQVHDEAVSDAYIAALGAPSSGGIPSEVQVTPFARNISPTGGGASPEQNFFAVIENSFTSLDTNSVRLSLNGQEVTPTLTVVGETTEVSVTNAALLPAGSTNTWELIYSDDATPASSVTNRIPFVVANYQTISIPAPLYFEDFEGTAEGSLPAGWTNLSFTEIQNPEEDLGNLDSATYGRWTVVEAERFRGTFVSYSDPFQVIDDYQRVLLSNPTYVISNRLVKDFASGKFAFANSGYRNGASQVLELYTPDFDLTGRANVHLVFHSIWEQNQDSIAGAEYSIDQGATWLPVVYMIHAADILSMDDQVLGAATLNAEHNDVARYLDNEGVERGGTYGAFIKAPISDALAPFISGRIDDDPRDSKRIEIFRLPDADNQAKVRFRFFHAGTDSWYYGIDNFGLYSIVPVDPPDQVVISKSGDNVIISIPGGARLQKATSLSTPDWQTLDTPAGASSYTEAASGSTAFFRAVAP